jgi:xanthine dehydrogenase large subunit
MNRTENIKDFYDNYLHVRGESLFVDDLKLHENTLFASVFSSSVAFGRIKNIDFKGLERRDDVFIFTASDIPGMNEIGGIVQDEKLFADSEVHYAGQPLGLIVTSSAELSASLVKEIAIDYEEYKPILDAREAQKKNNLIIPVRVFECGNTEIAFRKSEYIIEDSIEFGSQEHLYLETQGSVAIPAEGDNIKIISSTQNPTAIQKVASQVLKIPQNNIEVDVLRLGGGFGGKEDQATAWAVMAALAAYKIKKPVKIILDRPDDLKMTGKRHPYSIDFKLGLDKKFKITAYEVTFYQNAGAAADLSPAVLDRTLFHCNGSYFIPNLKATGYSCKTNLPPNTAFRGFGAPQGIFAIESAIYLASRKLNVRPELIQELNLLKEGDKFHYGQKAVNCNVIKCWKKLKKNIGYDEKIKEISDFNRSNSGLIKGYSIIPLTFGISFTNTPMNQASALVNVYSDGSVSVSTAAVEMGQGVNTKIRQVVAKTFGIDISLIKVETTNTHRIANTSPTAASTGADLNGMAALYACIEIKNRIFNFAREKYKLPAKSVLTLRNGILYTGGKNSGKKWQNIVKDSLGERVNLSAHFNYATPNIYFDKILNKGNPFAYHAYGSAFIEVLLNPVLGIFDISRVDIVHDAGNSINNIIDRGQIEGALIQGIGMMTLEEVLYDKKGKLISNSLSKYKVPDIYFVPENLNIEFLRNTKNKSGIMGSKAVGEPPLIYGISAYFAVLSAILDHSKSKIKIKSPMTNERIFAYLHQM